MRIVTLDELYEMEAQHDPSLVFHGTASCFAEQIETQGWPVDWRPYAWEDIEYVMELAKTVQLHANAFLLHNHETQRNRRHGGYFTYILEGAVQYSGATGGETIRNALRLAMSVIEVLAKKTGQEDDVQRLAKLIATWKAWVFESVRVVYAVRATDEAFPDKDFTGIVSRSKRSFAYQLENCGEVFQKQGDFWATENIAPSAIVAKAALSDLPIEKL